MRVERYSDTLLALLEAARSAGVFVIGRVQDVRDRSFSANNGVLERVGGGQAAGIGVHVFTPDGLIGFASSDRFSPEEAARLVAEASRFAKASAALDPERSQVVFGLPPGRRRIEPVRARDLATTPT